MQNGLEKGVLVQERDQTLVQRVEKVLRTELEGFPRWRRRIQDRVGEGVRNLEALQQLHSQYLACIPLPVNQLTWSRPSGNRSDCVNPFRETSRSRLTTAGNRKVINSTYAVDDNRWRESASCQIIVRIHSFVMQ